MVIKNGKASARRKSASSSAKSSRSATVSKSNSRSSNGKAADQLDGDIDCTEAATVESEASDRVLEKAWTGDGAPGPDMSAKPTELTAITLHQPWASLIAVGKKCYETRSWGTDYRGPIAIHAAKKLHENESLISLLEIEADKIPLGAIVAIANLTDCILMDQEFILKQSAFEQYLGLWEVGRYAWKLENVRAIEPIPATGKQGLWKWEYKRDWQKEFFEIDDSIKYLDQSSAWNPADFGEAEYKSDGNGQLNFLQVNEPPEPDDYKSIELFDKAYKQWCDAQTDEAEEELANYGEQELCNTLINGSTFVQESVPASPLQESNCGDDRPTFSANGTTTAETSYSSDTQTLTNTPTSTMSASQNHDLTAEYSSSLLHRLANLSQLMENGSQPMIIETASQQCSEQSENCNPNLQLLKMSPDFLAATSENGGQENQLLSPQKKLQQVHISEGFFGSCMNAGTMQNGKLSAAPTLPAPGVGKDSLLLRSPGALSLTGKTSPPGKTRLESQLHQLGLIQDGEVVNPEFLETGYSLPIGFTNLEENRTAIELAQFQALQLPIAPKSESPVEIQTTAIDVQPLATPSTGELLLSDSSELIISLTLPPNVGALTKAELISMAQEQHQLICVIERKEFELAIEKLHRVRLTGVYLQEFKKKCQYGEFESQLEQAGISVRSAQNYMAIAKNWEIVEAKTKLVSLLSEESQPAIGLKWALEAVRDEKKSLKSAAPPADPDCWRTPNTKDQPIVDLVKKALGGSIWCDPCADAGHRISASVHYNRSDDGLADHQTWSKTVFINPPFSNPLPWVEKCCLSIARGNVSAAIMLLKAGAVSNVGTGELINKYASAVCHWRGRINFLNDSGNPVKGSDFDCVLVYLGDRLDLFRQAFSGRGTITTIDNHYSSVNKKYQLPESYNSVAAEQKQMAAAVGLKNGHSLLPDMRDRDRDLMEAHDPSTVFDNMPTVSSNFFDSIEQSEIFDRTSQVVDVDRLEQAKLNCLNDYITAISSNLAEFSDEQIAFLAKIVNAESVKRIGF